MAKIQWFVQLVDEGTLDTVVEVNGYRISYDQEYASQFRAKDGAITDKGWKRLIKQAVIDYQADNEDARFDKPTAIEVLTPKD